MYTDRRDRAVKQEQTLVSVPTARDAISRHSDPQTHPSIVLGLALLSSGNLFLPVFNL